MAKILILYASHDGQTKKIADRLAAQALGGRRKVDLFDLEEATPSESLIEQADLIVVAAAIRYGNPLKSADAFLTVYTRSLLHKPLVLLSINLTARKPEKRTSETSVYLRKWIARHQLQPLFAEAIAGRLDYPSYGPFDRFMIRLIMKMTKGPTDPKAQIEFTDWHQVRAIADRLVTHVACDH